MRVNSSGLATIRDRHSSVAERGPSARRAHRPRRAGLPWPEESLRVAIALPAGARRQRRRPMPRSGNRSGAERGAGTGRGRNKTAPCTACNNRLFKQAGGGGVDGTRRSPDGPGGERTLPRRGRRDLARSTTGPTGTKGRNPVADRPPRAGPPGRPAAPSTMFPSNGAPELDVALIARQYRSSRDRSATATARDLLAR
jgi:hypothetical protein